MKERQKQEYMAFASDLGRVYRWHVLCADGYMFSAISRTESGAFRVLDAERPGVPTVGEWSTTEVPGRRDLQREYARRELRDMDGGA